MEEEQIIKKFMLEEVVKDVKIENWKNSDSLLQSGIVDSVKIVEILAFIEEEFRITVEAEELVQENFETINSICSLIRKKRSKITPDNPRLHGA